MKIIFDSKKKTVVCSDVSSKEMTNDQIKGLISSLLMHIEACIDLYDSHKDVYNRIYKLRDEYLRNVLEIMVNHNMDNGGEVPPEVLTALRNNKNVNWFDGD